MSLKMGPKGAVTEDPRTTGAYASVLMQAVGQELRYVGVAQAVEADALGQLKPSEQQRHT